MGFLRRLLGASHDERDTDRPQDAGDRAGPGAVDPDEEERAHALDLARFEQDRTGDLVRRQQQYADRSWTPPAQGGERRSEDEDEDRSAD